MNKLVKIILIIIAVTAAACLIGLAVTGYIIGWGPFAELRYYNSTCYSISDESYKYTRTKVNIQGENGNICGMLYLADTGEEKQQLVILSHGLATEMWHNINTAESLAKGGISVLMFDYCGGSIHSKSDMATTEMSVLTEKQDLNDVIDAVKTWSFVDPERIGVIGYSQGGLVAALTAVERDDIYRLCLTYPAFPMVEEIKNTYTSATDIPETVNRNGMLVGSRYYRDIVELPFDDVIAYCAAYPQATLIIHGTADALVPYEYSVIANDQYPDSTLLTIENGQHGFTGEDDVLCVKAQYEFFQ